MKIYNDGGGEAELSDHYPSWSDEQLANSIRYCESTLEFWTQEEDLAQRRLQFAHDVVVETATVWRKLLSESLRRHGN